MELTIKERAILEHMLVDVDAWVAHALGSRAGEPAVAAKIERWRPVYLAEKDKPDYMNRAEREAFAEANKPGPTQKELDEKKIQAKVRELAIAEIKKTDPDFLETAR